MSLTGETFMGSVPHARSDVDYGDVVAAWLRQKHPHHTAKMVAADLSAVGLGACTVRTAENLLGGHLSGKTFARLSLAYGLGFILDAHAAYAGETLETFIEQQAARARNEQSRWETLQARLASERDARASERASFVGRGSERRSVPCVRDMRDLG